MKSSQDLWFIAYVKMKGHSIAKYEVITRGKVRCFFDLSDDVWQQLKLDFSNSEASHLKVTIEQIKDLAF